jgi:hypothetical protein
MSRSKYGNRITFSADGKKFHSAKECARYGHLKLLEKTGHISNLTLQPRFKLPAGITYVADFSYHEKGKLIVEDVKGVLTAVFKLKKKLFHFTYPDLELRIT